MKNILVVNDREMILTAVIRALRSAHHSAFGIMVTPKGSVPYETEEKTAEELVQEADVILLDHDMGRGVPEGDKWLLYWRQRVDLSKKRVIGTSLGHPQPYLAEEVNPALVVEYLEKNPEPPKHT